LSRGEPVHVLFLLEGLGSEEEEGEGEMKDEGDAEDEGENGRFELVGSSESGAFGWCEGGEGEGEIEGEASGKSKNNNHPIPRSHNEKMTLPQLSWTRWFPVINTASSGVYRYVDLS
jgi:hypothetical protein